MTNWYIILKKDGVEKYLCKYEDMATYFIYYLIPEILPKIDNESSIDEVIDIFINHNIDMNNRYKEDSMKMYKEMGMFQLTKDKMLDISNLKSIDSLDNSVYYVYEIDLDNLKVTIKYSDVWLKVSELDKFKLVLEYNFWI